MDVYSWLIQIYPGDLNWIHLLTSTREKLSTYFDPVVGYTDYPLLLLGYFIRVHKGNLCDPISHFGVKASISITKC